MSGTKPQIKEILIAKIRRDSGAQFRPALPKGGVEGREWLMKSHVAEIVEGIESGAAIPPIEVFFDGTTFWLADGDHRIEAYLQAERKTIQAEIKKGTQLDARRRGRSANSEHKALKRSTYTKKAQVLDALKDPEWQGWSYNAIAEYCNVSQPFVKQVASENGAHLQIFEDSGTRKVQRGDSVYEMKTGNIGARSQEKTPLIQEIPLDQIHQIYDDPEFQARYPMAFFKQLGFAFDGSQEYIGFNKSIEENSEPNPSKPLMISVYPDKYFPESLIEVSVVWQGGETKSGTKEPEPWQMLVFRLDSLGVPQTMLSDFTWKSVPATVCNDVNTGIKGIIADAAEIGHHLLEVKEILKDSTAPNADFETYVEAENALGGTMDGAELLMAFANRVDAGKEADADLIDAAMNALAAWGKPQELLAA